MNSMKTCISAAYPRYRVKMAYENALIDRPVLGTGVYIAADEIREGELDFVIFVYTPLSGGGSECMKTACEIYNVLYEGGLKLRNIVIGAVEYSGESQGFAVKIKGTAEDDSIQFDEPEVTPTISRIICNAVYEREDRTDYHSFLVLSCKVVCNDLYYPIMTVFESKPFEFLDDERNHKIVMDGVLKRDLRYLMSSRSFKLTVDNVEMTFNNCCCDKFESDSDGKYTVTIIGEAEEI